MSRQNGRGGGGKIFVTVAAGVAEAFKGDSSTATPVRATGAVMMALAKYRASLAEWVRTT